jgi:hypothetical protein
MIAGVGVAWRVVHSLTITEGKYTNETIVKSFAGCKPVMKSQNFVPPEARRI